MSPIRDRLLASCVPALLAAIATSQLVLAQAGDLSPWKGGGFGMFATVDSPASRFLRITLLTPRGEVAVSLPLELAELGQQCRTWPSPGRLARLAEALQAGTWVPLEYESAVARFHRLALRPGGPGGGDLPESGGADPRADLGDLPADRRRLRLGLLRMRGPDEADTVPSEVFSAVRVELWRARFDAVGRTLHAERWFEATAPRG